VPFAIDAYLPAIESMANEFDVTVQRMSLSISIFFLGYALGQLFGGPLSDQVGRKVMALIGMSIFMAATVGIIFSSTVDQILVLRFIQAIGGGFTSVIGMASMRDVYPAHEAGRKFAIVIMIMLAMPLIAPFLGTFLLDYGWKSIFIALLGFVFLLACWMFWGIPETRVVEERKVNVVKIFQQFKGVILKRTGEDILAIRYVFSLAFTGGLLLIFITNSSFLYLEHFGVSDKHFPFYFGCNILLMVSTVRYSMHRMKTVHPHRLFIIGNGIQLVCSLLMLAYFVFFTPTLYPTLLFVVLSVGSMGLVSPNAAAVYISYYDELSGSATSFNSMSILLVGGLTGAFVALLLADSILPIAIGMAGCTLISNINGWLMPWPKGKFEKG